METSPDPAGAAAGRGRRAIPWGAASIAVLVAVLVGVSLYEDECSGMLVVRERAALESETPWWLLGERCRQTLPGGQTEDATVVFSYAFALTLSAGVGAWFAAAGALGLASRRRAGFAVSLCVCVFAVATLLFFL